MSDGISISEIAYFGPQDAKTGIKWGCRKGT